MVNSSLLAIDRIDLPQDQGQHVLRVRQDPRTPWRLPGTLGGGRRRWGCRLSTMPGG